MEDVCQEEVIDITSLFGFEPTSSKATSSTLPSTTCPSSSSSSSSSTSIAKDSTTLALKTLPILSLPILTLLTSLPEKSFVHVLTYLRPLPRVICHYWLDLCDKVTRENIQRGFAKVFSSAITLAQSSCHPSSSSCSSSSLSSPTPSSTSSSSPNVTSSLLTEDIANQDENDNNFSDYLSIHIIRGWTDESSRSLSIDIEKALHTHCASQVNKTYSVRARSLIFNLTRNSMLCAQVMLGKIPPSSLVLLSPGEMATNKKACQRKQWVEEKLRLQTKKSSDISAHHLISSYSSCPHCGNGESVLWQLRKGHLGDRIAVARKCLRCGGLHGDLP